MKQANERLEELVRSNNKLQLQVAKLSARQRIDEDLLTLFVFSHERPQALLQLWRENASQSEVGSLMTWLKLDGQRQEDVLPYREAIQERLDMWLTCLQKAVEFHEGSSESDQDGE
jgi:hypothetical protein